MTDYIVHNLVQGSPEWQAFRFRYHGASEAAAMLGLSPNMKRNELLHLKKTAMPKEFSQFVQERILDRGHELEALARPLVEEDLGEELYPVTCSLGKESASCDGLTMAGDIAFEHKQWNEELAALVRQGIVPDSHMPQCQQIAMVVRTVERVRFVVSDGTRERFVWTDVTPDPAWFERIRAGWAQFDKDVADYEPREIEAKPEGRTPETLPALRLEVRGEVTASNLSAFKDHALAVFAGINRELTTDQHFADAEKTVKWCGDVESRLAAAKEHALSQTASIDLLFKTIDDITAEARRVRLDLDKLVTKRKGEIKDNIVLGGKSAYEKHIADLRNETGAWIVLAPPDFAGAIKGKRSVASMQDAVDTVLANAKIEADASAQRIRANLACIKDDGAGYEFLFADKLALISKPIDDLKVLIAARITEHKAAEEKRQEADRERIRAEEQAKAEAKVAEAVKVVQPVAAPAPAPAPTPTPVVRHVARTAPSAAPTLRLGQINERLAPIALTAEGLATLGFKHAATDKAAKLYHEGDFELICAALTRHIEAALHKQAA